MRQLQMGQMPGEVEIRPDLLNSGFHGIFRRVDGLHDCVFDAGPDRCRLCFDAVAVLFSERLFFETEGCEDVRSGPDPSQI